jgi:hypothetical protein
VLGSSFVFWAAFGHFWMEDENRVEACVGAAVVEDVQRRRLELEARQRE